MASQVGTGKKWSFSAGIDQQPAFIEFVGPVVLRAEYNRNTQMLRVFSEEFDISKSNVMLVHQVDDPEHRKPVALGRIDLNIPPAANPATYVLDTHKNIRDVVMPKEQ